MNDFYEIIRYDDILNMELKGADLEDFEKGLEGAFDEYRRLLDNGEDVRLQTFVSVSHFAELEFFLAQGFYINNTMLTLEMDLEEPFEIATADIEVSIEEYDVKRDGISTYLKANGFGFGKADPENMIRKQLELPNSHIIVAKNKGKIVSSVTVWEAEDKAYCTENVFTIPSFREKHIAIHLFTTVLAALRDCGVKTARLTVYGDDAAAINMYLGLGFTVSGAKYELMY